MFSQACFLCALYIESHRKNLKVFSGNITMTRPERRSWLFVSLTEPEVYVLSSPE